MAVVSSETLHASCVALGKRAVLIEGRSGSGKSDLALRLIDRGGTLVSDDSVIVRRDGETLKASAPATIAGKLELRGVGILELPTARDVPVGLLVRLVDGEVERFPLVRQTRRVAGIDLPVIMLNGFEASATAKVAHALSLLGA